MDGHDIIVIGASAGGVEALRQIASELPSGLDAAVFVVVHFPADASSSLPEILSRAGAFPARHVADGDTIEPGRIYVAPPDRHMLVEPGRVRLSRGPRENGHRPAVDPLFRSASRAYGPRVIGVVLTGNLDDGTAGLASVHRHGGITVVQDPADAAHPGMPSSALANVKVDRCVPLAEMGALLARLAAEPAPQAAPAPADDELDRFETDLAEMEPYALHADERPGIPSGFSCPECHGVLFEVHDGELVRYRCRVGHAFGAETLLAEQGDAVENALWAAFQTLKERAAFARQMARKMEQRGNFRSRERFQDQAAEAESRAAAIREVLRGHPRAAAALADTGSAAIKTR